MIYAELLSLLSQGAVVVATVISTKGSVPREVGAKMLITCDRCIDTIGGGAGEAKVIALAREVLQTGEKRRVEIDLTGSPKRQTEGVCGGWMEVLLERWQGDIAIAIARQIITELKLGRSVTLVTPFADGYPYLIKEKGERKKEKDSEAFIKEKGKRKKEKDSEAFIEVLEPVPMLLIVGAGHVGEQLARVAHLIGFQIAIQDDRPEWANSERYPQAAFIYSNIDQALEELSNHSSLHVALVTRGYRYDLDALMALLNRDLPCAYIGMIGSERRVMQVYEQTKLMGISEDKLTSIYAPIGLDIGALTPAEIAVSISAELIMLRRGGTGRSLSCHLREKANCQMAVNQSVNQYREYIQNILLENSQRSSKNKLFSEYEVQTIFDTERDHYQLLRVGWRNNKRDFGCVLHLDIKDDKIWIQHDSTDTGIAVQLLEMGVPKEDIVLAFHEPEVRQFTGFGC